MIDKLLACPRVTGLFSIGGYDARTSLLGLGGLTQNLVGYAGGLDYHDAGIEGEYRFLQSSSCYANSGDYTQATQASREKMLTLGMIIPSRQTCTCR